MEEARRIKSVERKREEEICGGGGERGSEKGSRGGK